MDHRGVPCAGCPPEGGATLTKAPKLRMRVTVPGKQDQTRQDKVHKPLKCSQDIEATPYRTAFVELFLCTARPMNCAGVDP